MKRVLIALLALLCAVSAYAQNQGTITANAFAIGKGPGITGYSSLLCGAGQIAIGQAGAPQCFALSGDATMNAAGLVTLAAINAGVGTFGSATQCAIITANAKGQITAASQALCTPAASSITGQVALANGGTSAALVANNGGIVYSGASALAVLNGSPNANFPLLSGAASSPSWAGIAYPTTSTQGGILWFNSTSSLAATALMAQNQLMIGGGTGSPPSTLGSLGTTTTVLHGNASGPPSFGPVNLSTETAGTLQAAQEPAHTGDCTNTAGSLALTCLKTNGVAFTATATAATGQIPATATNDNATAGNVGERKDASVLIGSAVALVTGTTSNVTNISLTAGDWEVSGVVALIAGATTNVKQVFGSISTTSATLDASTPGRFSNSVWDSTNGIVPGNTAAFTQVLPPTRFSLASTTTVYLVAQGSFTVSTLSAYGEIHAVRVR